MCSPVWLQCVYGKYQVYHRPLTSRCAELGFPQTRCLGSIYRAQCNMATVAVYSGWLSFLNSSYSPQEYTLLPRMKLSIQFQPLPRIMFSGSNSVSTE